MIKSIFTQVLSDYKSVMNHYMKSTGGEDGEDASYCLWEEREDTNILCYQNSTTSQYLTWVFMYDKQYDFVLSKRKGLLPLGTGLDNNQSSSYTTPARTNKSGQNIPNCDVLANKFRLNCEASIAQTTEMNSVLKSMVQGETTSSLTELHSHRDVLNDIAEHRSCLKELKAEN